MGVGCSPSVLEAGDDGADEAALCLSARFMHCGLSQANELQLTGLNRHTWTPSGLIAMKL